MASNEQDIFRVRPSFVPVLALLIGLFITVIITSIIVFKVAVALAYTLIGAMVLIGLIILMSWFTSVYALTSERLEYRFGIIGSKDDSIEIDNVSSLQLKQGFLGKIFDFGDILAEGDSVKSEIIFKNIHFAKKRYQQIKRETIDKRNIT